METIVYGLGAVAVVIAVVVALRYLGRFLSWVERSEIARQKAEAERAKDASEKPPRRARRRCVPRRTRRRSRHDHIAAIAAAVAAYGYRVVHIADAASGHAWASEGRWLHQTSHRPH